MWFAFKIYIFGFLIQLPDISSGYPRCCDLLSKFISLAFWYNLPFCTLRPPPVVICFQNLYLWLSDTTCPSAPSDHRQLWFAFKIYIFGFLIQHNCICSQLRYCCDLLSKFISLAFWYNRSVYKPRYRLLWFAFKIYIFGFLIQLEKIIFEHESGCDCFQNLYLWLSDTTGRELGVKFTGCDLLSKFISLAFWYNKGIDEYKPIMVVICFQNLYLWLSDTTLS